MKTLEDSTPTEYALRPDFLYRLLDSELWWRDRQEALEARGYLLRPRFRPGWEPSWLKKNAKEKDPVFCEDSLLLPHPKTIDATRLSDGKTVYIKRIWASDSELDIASFLSSPENIEDPRNHCVRILDHFDDELEPNIKFIVMPLLRRFDSPSFYYVDEVIDFIRQTLKGLSFIHSKDVAHRDGSLSNIMMDGEGLFPLGFHPTHQKRTKTSSRLASYRNRRDVATGVRYYFTDFGLSTRFTGRDEPRLVTGVVCQDDVPELSDEIPYDPFAVDVFLLGKVYKKTFMQNYTNLSFLEPLVNSMIELDAKARPSADDAFLHFMKIVSEQDAKLLRWRLKKPDDGKLSSFFLNAPCVWREFLIRLKGRLITYRRAGGKRIESFYL